PADHRTGGLTMADRDPTERLVAADYQAMAAFRQALRRFAAFSETAAQSVGLTPQQHQALLAIRAHAGAEPMTISELADALMIKNHSAVGLVARLVERDLVTRSPSPLGRRRRPRASWSAWSRSTFANSPPARRSSASSSRRSAGWRRSLGPRSAPAA